jgi:hypothetical protein
MDRLAFIRSRAHEGLHRAHSENLPNPAEVAEEIGVKALELADRARSAGLMVLCQLLESAALTAAADGLAAEWPADGR